VVRGALIAAFCWVAPAVAQTEDWPALFDVSGVASDDVLNIRSMSSAQSEIIGALTPDATNIEVIQPSDNGRWGQINFGERTGWVSLRFLARQAGQTGSSYPDIRACYGTEPGWSLRTDGEVAQMTVPEETLIDGYLRDGFRSENRPDIFGFAAGDNDGQVQGVLRRELCSDGMSDRLFGLSMTLTYTGTKGHRTLSGCCAISDWR